MSKVFIQTYGCQMNEYDTDKMFELLRAQDFTPTISMEDADLVLLNTCSVREKAEQKVYSELGRMRRLKKLNPTMKIGVGGCVAQQEGAKILKRAQNVDFVFGSYKPTGTKTKSQGFYSGISFFGFSSSNSQGPSCHYQRLQ